MKFLYKIYSRHDGFEPARIPERMNAHKILELGWTRYIESAERGDEVWVYFHGNDERFKPGVYIRGRIKSIRPRTSRVFLRVIQHDAERPLTDSKTSKIVARAVAPKGRQVFVFPERWEEAPCCIDDSSNDSCNEGMCSACPSWKKLPLVSRNALGWPARLPSDTCSRFVPAYWVIPRRCAVRGLKAGIKLTSAVFMRFKLGATTLAIPLALGMYARLCRTKQTDFDCIVPIPLSPDKAKKKEIHRTRLLAREVGKLLGVKVAELLQLKKSISKRGLRIGQGLSACQFEEAYAKALIADPKLKRYRRVLLIDDVCTEGSTLACAIDAIRSVSPDCEIVAATAGQMVVKATVKKLRLLK